MQGEKSITKRFTLKATSTSYQKEDNERVQMSKDEEIVQIKRLYKLHKKKKLARMRGNNLKRKIERKTCVITMGFLRWLIRDFNDG